MKPKPSKGKNLYSISTQTLAKGIHFITGKNSQIPPEPTIHYTPKVAAQIEYIVDKCAQEVGWFHLVKYDKRTNTYLLYDTIIPEQTVSSVETDISGAAWGKCANQLINEEKDVSHMYAWFHSHVNMAVHPSGQDEAQVEEFLEQSPIIIRGIVNKRGESKVDIYYRDKGVAYTCLTEKVAYPEYTEWVDGIDDILKTNVKRQIPRQKPPRYPTYNHFSNNKPHNGLRQQGSNDHYSPTSSYDLEFYGIDYEEDETNLIAHLEDTHGGEDTGFDTTWFLSTPKANRPKGWETDPYYLLYGYHDDKKGQH